MDRPGGPDERGSGAPAVVLMPELRGPVAVLFEGVPYVRSVQSGTTGAERREPVPDPTATTSVVLPLT